MAWQRDTPQNSPECSEDLFGHLPRRLSGDPKEQVRAEGRRHGQFGQQVEKQGCCRDLIGRVKCSVLARALGFPKAEIRRTSKH